MFAATWRAFWALIWSAMLWRYKGTNEKQTELYDLLNKKAQLENDIAAKAQNELKETIASLTKQLEDLTKKKDQASENMQAAFERLEQTSSTATRQLEKLSRANTAVSETLSDSRRLISWPPAMSMSSMGSPRPLLDSAAPKSDER